MMPTFSGVNFVYFDTMSSDDHLNVKFYMNHYSKETNPSIINIAGIQELNHNIWVF